MKYTTEVPQSCGYYWEKSDYQNSRPFVTYRISLDSYEEGDELPVSYREPGRWLFAGPMRTPKISEFQTGVPETPGCYLELIDEESCTNGKMALPFVILSGRPISHKTMTYYGPFPEPEE